MELYNLGPNGGLIYCIETLEKNVDWLINKLKEFEDCYFLFDCPGQVELYTHNTALRNIIRRLEKEGFRLCCVHLVDAFHCSNPSNYISTSLVSLNTMLQLELPHINVLSKVDLIEKNGTLDFSLEYYTQPDDMTVMAELIQYYYSF